MVELLDYMPPQWQPLKREPFIFGPGEVYSWVQQHGLVRWREGVGSELVIDDNHMSESKTA